MIIWARVAAVIGGLIALIVGNALLAAPTAAAIRALGLWSYPFIFLAGMAMTLLVYEILLPTDYARFKNAAPWFRNMLAFLHRVVMPSDKPSTNAFLVWFNGLSFVATVERWWDGLDRFAWVHTAKPFLVMLLSTVFVSPLLGAVIARRRKLPYGKAWKYATWCVLIQAIVNTAAYLHVMGKVFG